MKPINLILSFVFLLLFIAVLDMASANSQTAPDPDLQAGFPVQTFHTAGFYVGGPSLHTLVANLDADPSLEIVNTALSLGPLYAWNADGSLLSGWPANVPNLAAYPAAGNLQGSSHTLEIVAPYDDGMVFSFSGTGNVLPGWPKSVSNGFFPPSLADIDGDGLEEIFISHNDWTIHAYKADGTELPGWPFPVVGFQTLFTPAIADLDGDGDLEIISATYQINSYTNVYAYHHTGTPVQGFPYTYHGVSYNYPAVGDVDNDGQPEIVIAGTDGELHVISATGVLERILKADQPFSYGALPGLADLDGDGAPEIIAQTERSLCVWKGDGSLFPGWPQVFGDNFWKGYSEPVIGDVDGDQLPDILITLQVAGMSEDGEVRLYNRNGVLHPHFPKTIKIGFSSIPAIADIDLDGRNEIIITGHYWNGHIDFFDKLWVYDLGGGKHGKIEWGQLGGGPGHRFVYPVPALPPLPSVWPDGSHQLYLPMALRPLTPVTNDIHGEVLYNNKPTSNTPLELQFFDGINWATTVKTTTNISGRYSFGGLPALDVNQAYLVRYVNESFIPGRLAVWSTRALTSYTAGSAGMSDMELSDLSLISPSNGENGVIPVTFTWKPRSTAGLEFYSLVIFDPVDGDPAYLGIPVRNTDGLALNGLPPGINFGIPYAWTIWIFGADGSVGVPSEARQITFTSGESLHNAGVSDTLQLLDWGNFPDLPCSIYHFLPYCTKTVH
jgi:hypothetical protein